MKVQGKTCLKVGVSIFLLYLAIHYWPALAGFAASAVWTMATAAGAGASWASRVGRARLASRTARAAQQTDRLR